MEKDKPEEIPDNVPRIKIMVVGQENVGKTSLVRAFKLFNQTQKKKRDVYFRNRAKSRKSSTHPRRDKEKEKEKEKETSAANSLQVSGDTLSTDGIAIDRLEFETSEGKPFDFYVWDFGGQEVYYTTHSFFLSERSIYLVVFNILDEMYSAVEYWCSTIEVHAPNAPIVLVATHIDKRKGKPNDLSDLNNIIKPLKKKFRQIKDIIGVSTTGGGRNMEDLMTAISEIAVKDPAIQIVLPTKLFILERVLATVERQRYVAKKQVPIMSWKEFSEKANSLQVGKTGTQEEKQEELFEAAQILHSLGTILHFHNGHEHFVILDPEWIIYLFKTLITTKHAFVKDGIIPQASICDHIWKEPDFPPEFHSSLFGVFETFEVMFHLTPDMKEHMNINNNAEIYLIPSLLPISKPPDLFKLWLGIGKLNFSRKYTFPFLPNGLWNRFLFRLMKFAPPIRYWRYGVLIKNKTDNTLALVELKSVYNVITVEVRNEFSSPTAADFFCHIVELLEFLLENCYTVEADVSYIDPVSTFKFSREEIETAALKGEWLLKTHGMAIRLDTVAPDLALTGLSEYEIRNFSEELVLGELLGEGSFSQVYKGTFKDKTVAVKRLTMGKIQNPEQARAIFNEFRNEVITMSLLHHPNAVNLVAYSLEIPFSLIMEYIELGSLYDFLSKANPPSKLLSPRAKQPPPIFSGLSWAFRMRVCHDIASCMSFLHSVEPPLIHRDLKSPNILLASTVYTAQEVAKVSDFGITNKLYSEFKAIKARERVVANPTWLAPEIMREEVSGAPADVFPFGVIMWELLTCAHPYDEFELSFASDLENGVITGMRPTIPSDCPPLYAKLMSDCWDGLPQNRPSYREILHRLPEIIKEISPELLSILENVSQANINKEEKKAKKLSICKPHLGIWSSFSTVYDSLDNWSNMEGFPAEPETVQVLNPNRTRPLPERSTSAGPAVALKKPFTNLLNMTTLAEVNEGPVWEYEYCVGEDWIKFDAATQKRIQNALFEGKPVLILQNIAEDFIIEFEKETWKSQGNTGSFRKISKRPPVRPTPLPPLRPPMGLNVSAPISPRMSPISPRVLPPPPVHSPRLYSTLKLPSPPPQTLPVSSHISLQNLQPTTPSTPPHFLNQTQPSNLPTTKFPTIPPIPPPSPPLSTHNSNPSPPSVPPTSNPSLPQIHSNSSPLIPPPPSTTPPPFSQSADVPSAGSNDNEAHNPEDPLPHKRVVKSEGKTNSPYTGKKYTGPRFPAKIPIVFHEVEKLKRAKGKEKSLSTTSESNENPSENESSKTEDSEDKVLFVASKDDSIQTTWSQSPTQPEPQLQTVLFCISESPEFPGPLPDKIDEFSLKQLLWLKDIVNKQIALEEKKKSKKPAFAISTKQSKNIL